MEPTSSLADWISLPTELYLNIFSYLRIIDIRQVNLVCSLWREIFQDNEGEILKPLCCEKWNIPQEQASEILVSSWREAFKTSREAMHNILDLVEISFFEQSSSLNLAGNHASVLPKSIIQLSQLVRLDLSNNSLSFLPSLDNFVNLEWLILSRNHLTSLPDLSRLTKLVSLDASENNIIEIPPSIKDCKSIKWLSFSYNRIKTVPNLLKLKKLQGLFVDNNNLDFFRVSEVSSGIVILDLDNNNFSMERPNILPNLESFSCNPRKQLGV